MTPTSASPRVYVASLSDYNAGRLHGEWIDAAQDLDDFWAEVTEMLAKSPEPIAEEWAIHDYEGFGPIRLSEYESFETVTAIASAIEEHGDAFAVWYDNCDGHAYDADEMTDRFSEQYRGHWDSPADYAQQLFEDTAPSVEVRDAINDWPFSCIDWEHAASELRMGGDCTFVDAGAPEWGVYVFEENA